MFVGRKVIKLCLLRLMNKNRTKTAVQCIAKISSSQQLIFGSIRLFFKNTLCNFIFLKLVQVICCSFGTIFWLYFCQNFWVFFRCISSILLQSIFAVFFELVHGLFFTVFLVSHWRIQEGRQGRATPSGSNFSYFHTVYAGVGGRQFDQINGLGSAPPSGMDIFSQIFLGYFFHSISCISSGYFSVFREVY